MMQYIIAAILFVLGLAAIGGATFGRQRNQRLILTVAGIALWGVTLFLYGRAASPPAVAPAPATPEVLIEATDTPPPPEIAARIAFHSDRAGNFDIWVMNADGTELRQLTDSPERDIEPDWSPDGSQIIFSSGRDDPRFIQLYRMNADGSEQRPLMDFIEGNQVGGRWSPDGQSILFHSNLATEGQVWLRIYRVDSDGSGMMALTAPGTNNYMADWSPDGSQIVFVSERDSNRELYVMNADGSDPIRLTDHPANDIRPRWSPDGNWIVFESDREGLANIHLLPVPAEGLSGVMESEIRLLSFPFVNDEAPAWAFNGEKIIFSSDRDSEGLPTWDLYMMNADGSDVVRLTDHPDSDRYGTWTP